jgi:hypothetical protein
VGGVDEWGQLIDLTLKVRLGDLNFTGLQVELITHVTEEWDGVGLRQVPIEQVLDQRVDRFIAIAIRKQVREI